MTTDPCENVHLHFEGAEVSPLCGAEDDGPVLSREDNHLVKTFCGPCTVKHAEMFYGWWIGAEYLASNLEARILTLRRVLSDVDLPEDATSLMDEHKPFDADPRAFSGDQYVKFLSIGEQYRLWKEEQS